MKKRLLPAFNKTLLVIALSSISAGAIATNYTNTVSTSTVLDNGDSITTANTGVLAGVGVSITGTTGGLTIISTGTGSSTYGVYAQSTGFISLTGSSAAKSTISYAGTSAAVDVFNPTSAITLSYFDVDAIRGIGANANYGTINLDHTTFAVHGASSGFNADNGGKINANDVSITMDGTGGAMRTGSSNGGGTFILLGAANTVSAVGDNAGGLYAQGGAVWFGVDPVAPTLATGTKTSITTQGANAHGINIAPSAGTTTVTGAGLTITTNGAGANGAQTTTNGQIVLIGDNKIDTYGTNANGLVTISTGKIDAYSDASTGTGTLSITTNNTSSAGIISSNSVNLNDSKVVISTLGQSAFGAYASNGATISSNLSGSVTINTTGTAVTGQPASHALYATGVTTTADFAGALSLGTTGIGAHGVFAANGGYPDLGSTFKIVTTGDDAAAALMDGVASALALNDNSNSVDATHGITTSGANAHAIRVQNGANKTFDGSAGSVLPGVIVSGAGSAVLDAANNSLATDTGTASTAGAASALTISGNTALNMSMTLGADTWGAKAEDTSTITFAGNSSTGGTGLWAVGNGQLIFNNFSGTPDAAGSRVKLDDNSVLDLSGVGAGGGAVSIGSLDSTSTTAKVLLGGGALYIGAKNTAGKGSLLADASYAGVISGSGVLIKTGGNIQRLSGTGSQVDSVLVESNGASAGQRSTLSFEQNGVFTVDTDYFTYSGATTNLATNSQLNVGSSYMTYGGGITTMAANSRIMLTDLDGIFSQDAGSTLNVTLGSSQPMIIANTANLNGDLNVIGFTDSTFTSASQLTDPANYFTLIQTTLGIGGDFANNPPKPGSGIDYLVKRGFISTSGGLTNYNLGFKMAWTDGGQTMGTGDFTLNAGQNFDVDVPLADQVGTFDSAWDGKSLTKAGDGTLTLSAINAYTGDTSVKGGTLIVSAAPTAGDITAYAGVLSVDSGATLQTSAANIFNNAQSVAINGKWELQSGAIQTANNLSGASTGLISLGNANLTANNTSDTTFAGIISDTGGLNKTGLGKLTLSGANTYTGQTNITAGTLSIGTGGSIVSDTAVTAGNTLEFASANNLTYAGNISGAGSLTQVGSGKTTLTGLNSSIANVTVSAGTLDLGTIKSHISFAVAGDYTTLSGGTSNVSLASILNVGGNYLAQTGATTFLSANAKLAVNSVLTLTSGSTLKLILGQTPVITANSADITDATFHMLGFGGSATVNASDLPSSLYNVIKTTSGISGDFSNNPLNNNAPDYLIKHGYVSTNKLDYDLSFQMSWMDGGQALGTGSFSMDADTAFNVDVPLANQVGTFDSGWDGKSLTKAGEGILTLSTANTYTGDTNVKGGTLIVSAPPTAGDTTAYAGQLSIDSGATLQTSAENIFTNAKNVVVSGNWALQNDLNQTANNLSGAATGLIDIGNANFTANNTQDTTYSGAITGAGGLIKTGSANLTLTGATSWLGDTQLNAGSLTLDGTSGGAQLVSNIIGQAGATLNLNNGASLRGTVDPIDENISTSSTWYMTANSIVNNLNNAGTISFTNTTLAGNTLTVNGDYVGNAGLININTVLGDDNSVTDKLIIKGSTSGTTNIAVNNVAGVGAKTTSDGIEIVQVGGASNAVFSLSGRAVAGAYEYYLFKGAKNVANGNWYLRTQAVTPVPPGPVPPGPVPPGPEPVLRPEPGVYLANEYAANTMFLATLHDRLGEPEYANDVRGSGSHKVSSWGRVYGLHTQSRTDNSQISQNMNSSNLQVGTDLIRWFDNNNRINAGLMFSGGNTNDSATSLHNSAYASGSVSGYALGAYATWYANKNANSNVGLYVDSYLQYGNYKNKVNGDKLSDISYNSNNWIASLEAGYAIALGANNQNRQWYVEPEAQLIYTNYKQDELTENNGTKVSIQDSNSWSSRLGARLYGHQLLENGNKLQPFVELNWWHKQDDSAIQMNSDLVKQGIPANRIEAKLGAQMQATKAWNLYANVGLQAGSNKYKSFQAQVGVKYFW